MVLFIIFITKNECSKKTNDIEIILYCFSENKLVKKVPTTTEIVKIINTKGVVKFLGRKN